MKPLNGTKTHPLTPHAIGVLQSLCAGAKPTQEINAGVVNRLLREKLITVEQRPSPYVSGKGKDCGWAVITDSGRERAHAR